MSNKIKLEVTLNKVFYPKNSKFIPSGEFGIFSAKVVHCLEGEYTDDNIKLKGNCPCVEYGVTYKVICELESTHEKYGKTYKIDFMVRNADISTKEAQKEFLKNIISPRTLDELFNKFDDVISLLKNKDIKKLCSVKGIREKSAKKMIKKFEDTQDYSSIYIELGSVGLSDILIKKLVDHYNSTETVIDIVKNHPYKLVSVKGIGFKKADEIALKVGVERNSVDRIEAFFLDYLETKAEEGLSYLYYQQLMQALYDTLGFVPEGIVNATAKFMINQHEIIVSPDGQKIALKKYFKIETLILKELIRLQLGRSDYTDGLLFKSGREQVVNELDIYKILSKEKDQQNDWYYIPMDFKLDNPDKVIKSVEFEQGFEFTDEQKTAILSAINNNVITITGLGGTGKTSSAKGICSLYPKANIIACALSGKAALRITEATGFPASTIHKALKYQWDGFLHNANRPMIADIVLIDEATMINGTLFLQLLRAIPTGAKVIMLGDVNQLTPLGNCQVYGDILSANVFPTTRLTKPHRQALRSGIIPTSITIANQEPIFNSTFEGEQIVGELQDMKYVISNDKNADLLPLVIREFQEQMKLYNDVLEVQICVPMKIRGSLSCYSINNAIQQVYNPEFIEGNSITIPIGKKDDLKSYKIRVNDKVINRKNKYNMELYNEQSEEQQKELHVEYKEYDPFDDIFKSVFDENTNIKTSDPELVSVFNGNIGIIKEITDSGEAIIDFQGIGKVLFDKTDCNDLELAYACTCHSLQGSGFKSTIVAIDNSSFVMNNDELLYTAITRAKDYCVLIANNYAIQKCINTKEVRTKQTFLCDFLSNNAERFDRNKIEDFYDNYYYNDIFEFENDSTDEELEYVMDDE